MDRRKFLKALGWGAGAAAAAKISQTQPKSPVKDAGLAPLKGEGMAVHSDPAWMASREEFEEASKKRVYGYTPYGEPGEFEEWVRATGDKLREGLGDELHEHLRKQLAQYPDFDPTKPMEMGFSVSADSHWSDRDAHDRRLANMIAANIPPCLRLKYVHVSRKAEDFGSRWWYGFHYTPPDYLPSHANQTNWGIVRVTATERASIELREKHGEETSTTGS